MSAAGSLWRGRFALGAAVIIWSSPPIFQYWLAETFDPWTQNFYRYLAGFLAMAPFLAWILWRNPQRHRTIAWVGSAWAAVPNVVHQVAQTVAVVLLMPGVYALLGRVSVIITALLAVLCFADERWIIRSARFLIGTLLGLAGVAGLVWEPQTLEGAVIPWLGLGLALSASIGWATYGILVKKFTAQSGPSLGFGAISLLTTALLLPLMLVFGDAGAVLRADAWTNGVLFFSGVVSIGFGHWLYYIGIRHLGAAPSQSALLLCPLGTMLLSAALFGETFRWEQLVAGGVLLLGAFLALSARRPAVVEEPA